MKIRIFVALGVVLGLALLAPAGIVAEGLANVGFSPETGLSPDGVPRPLAPHSALWFQFTYGGDRTPIEIHLLDGGAPDISFALYTPEAMALRGRGEPYKPIGQMSRASGEPARELVWAGKFNGGGTYYVVVRNPSSLAHTIRLIARGSAVDFPHTIIQVTPLGSDDGGGADAPQDRAALTSAGPAAPLPANLTAGGAWVDIPEYVGVGSFSIPLTARPSRCTPANAMPGNVTRSILLCPNQLYAPFRVTGSNLTVYGDPTALVQGPPRGFGITVTGNNVSIVGVRVAATTHPADVNKWLCLFEACTYNTMYQNETVRGGIGYGGGILLKDNANSAVIHSIVWGGTIGVASVRGHNNRIIGNTLSNLNGWGAYLMFTRRNFVVGNTFDDVNRGCVGPDGFYYGSGCESAGFACVGCQDSVVVSNTCARAGNCYYATGDGGLPSNANKFYNNHCAAASNNCFEITFSQANKFDYNVATSDPNTGQQCAYPFWIAGSIVEFGKHNDWACTRGQKRAEEESKSATPLPTEIRGL
jgi:parallel beta-helix repeat protein